MGGKELRAAEKLKDSGVTRKQNIQYMSHVISTGGFPFSIELNVQYPRVQGTLYGTLTQSLSRIPDSREPNTVVSEKVQRD